MAQLKDSVVSGNLRVTDTTLTDTLQVTTIKAPTSAGGSTYGPGTNGQVLKSDGTSAYWGPDSAGTDENVKQSSTTTSNYRPLVLGKTDSANPDNLETLVTGQTYVSKHVFVQPSTGNLTLYSDSGDSPALIFRRGTLIDNIVDWRIYDTGGKLYFDRNQQGSAESWSNIINLDPTNSKMYFMNTEVSLLGHTHDDRYLKLTGGTITSSEWRAFTIKRSGTNSAAVHFENDNGRLGAIAMNAVNGSLLRWNTDGATSYVVLDTGNYTSYTYSSTASRTANTVLAAPNGSNGAATFRKLVSADMPSDIAPYEAYLKWGGKDFSGAYGPLDAALSPRLGANRMEFFPYGGTTIERSTDSGSTWAVASDVTNNQKVGLFTVTGTSINISATSTAGTGTDAAKNMMRLPFVY